VTQAADAKLLAELERLRVQVRALEEQAVALTQRAEAAEAAADHDVLTPALNRRGFMEALGRTVAFCQRYGTPATLLYLDMDGFKGVNDTYGHAAGDAALIYVAQQLIKNSRESDAVGRLGGDEFALLMLNAGAEEGRDKADRLNQTLGEGGFVWQDTSVPLGGSFGVRTWNGHSDADVWLAEADAAMWVRKKGR
jgi:diguanylate cyclase (GGDEF) domain